MFCLEWTCNIEHPSFPYWRCKKAACDFAMPEHPLPRHTRGPSPWHFALLGFWSPQLMLRVRPGHAEALRRTKPAVLGFSQPSLGSCPKKQDGFTISMFSWLTWAGVGLQRLGAHLGYGLSYILCSTAGWHGSWLLLHVPTFATHLCRVFRDLPLGTKQLLYMQPDAGAPFQLLVLSHWGGWGHAAFLSPAENSSSLLQQATASGWLVASCMLHWGLGERGYVSKSRRPPRWLSSGGQQERGAVCRGSKGIQERRATYMWEHDTSASGKAE